MPTAIAMLKADHAKVKRLLRELNASSSVRERERLCSQIERELKTHAQIEEEVFYPAFKAASEKTENENLFYEAAEEHHLVDIELPSLMAANPKSHEFEAKAKVLQDLVLHHVKEEEGEMFVAARQLFDDDQLRQLGDLMETRKEMIMGMWENPLTRPIKRAQGLVHKMLPTKIKNAKVNAIATAAESRTR